MSLKDTLANIVHSVEGSRAAVVLASDGIPIDEFVADQEGFDLQLLAVQYATVLRDVKRTIGMLEIGNAEELCITTGALHVALRMLADDLFVIVVLDRDGNCGKARYMLRLKSGELYEELC